jgi:hypothetical protein
MRSVLGTLAAVLIIGAAGAASAQTFLSPGALANGTRGYFGPGEPMPLPSEGRSASTASTRLWCDNGQVLCYPVTFRAISDMAAR